MSHGVAVGAPVSETERMSQTQLPIFPAGLKEISNHIAIQCEADQVVYFNGHLPVFQHAAADVQSFRLFTSQLIVQGTVSQSEIVQAFGVPRITVKRYVKLLREKGSKSFFAPPKRRGAPVLTPEVLRQAQQLLDEGRSLVEVGAELSVLSDTLHKAVRAGRLKKNSNRAECVAALQQERA